jgi:hypothetical protein
MGETKVSVGWWETRLRDVQSLPGFLVHEASIGHRDLGPDLGFAAIISRFEFTLPF